MNNTERLIKRIMKKKLKNNLTVSLDVDTIWEIGGISWEDHCNEMVMDLLEEEFCELVWGNDPEGLVRSVIEVIPDHWYKEGFVKYDED